MIEGDTMPKEAGSRTEMEGGPKVTYLKKPTRAEQVTVYYKCGACGNPAGRTQNGVYVECSFQGCPQAWKEVAIDDGVCFVD